MTTISVLGCGWLGLPLAVELVRSGWVVKGTTTSESKLGELKNKSIVPYLINLQPEADSLEDFFVSDLVIINIPPRNRNEDDLFHQKQLEFIAKQIEKNSVSKVIFISSTSVYSSVNKEVFENDASYESKSRGGISLLKMEDIFRKNKHFQTTIIRFSGLIGPKRHPGRFFSGEKTHKNGNLPVNLIHLDDCIGIIQTIIENNIWGETIQASCEDHPPKQDFYQAAAQRIKLKPPSFSSTNDIDYKIINSHKLIELTGYQFKYDRLIDAI